MSERFEFWHQAVSVEQRTAWERLHEELASLWRRHLGISTPVELERLSFETFGQLCEKEGEFGYYITLVAGVTRSKALLIFNYPLARELLELRLGKMDDETLRQRDGFSAFEEAILSQVSSVAIECIQQIYSAAGLGPVSGARRIKRLSDAASLGLTDQLVVCHFAASEDDGEGKILLAVQTTLVNALRSKVASENVPSRNTERIKKRVLELPVYADVVLGYWRVPIDDLTALKPGREILLPGPDEASLWVGDQRLHRLQITVEHDRLVLKITKAVATYGEH